MEMIVFYTSYKAKKIRKSQNRNLQIRLVIPFWNLIKVVYSNPLKKVHNLEN